MKLTPGRAILYGGLTVGTLDPLRDHSLFMYAEWLAHGSPAEIQIFPGGPHGFDMFPCPEQVQAHASIDAFLARCLDVGGFPAR